MRKSRVKGPFHIKNHWTARPVLANGKRHKTALGTQKATRRPGTDSITENPLKADTDTTVSVLYELFNTTDGGRKFSRGVIQRSHRQPFQARKGN